MLRRDISKALLATAAGSAVVAQRAEAQNCTAPCYAQTAAEMLATNPATGNPPVVPTNYAYAPGDIRRYGATSASAATALQAAINVMIKGGTQVYVPAGSWTISSQINIASGSGIAIVGDSEGASILVNAVTGDPANALFYITSQNDYFLFQDFQILGNNTAGTSGNGHAFAFINTSYPATLYPAAIVFSRVAINSHIGNGKDYQNINSIPACAVYLYGTNVTSFDNCFFYNNAMGVRILLSQKTHFNQCTIDGGLPGAPGLNNLYLDSVEEFAFVNGTLNSAGAGNPTDGNMYVTGTQSISLGVVLHSSRIKGGIPANVNLNGSVNCISRNIVISDNEFEQFTDPGSHTAAGILVGNGNSGTVIKANYFEFLYTFSAAVGVSVTQTSPGYNCGGLEISGNIFDIGSGGVYTAAVEMNVASGAVRSPIIRGNVIGPQTGTFTFTNGVLLNGNVDNPHIVSNHFIPGSSGNIATAININSSGVRWELIEANSYDTSNGGTITTTVSYAGIAGPRIEGGFVSLGDAASQVSLVTGGTITTASQALTRVSPSANVTGMILQAGNMRGQYCAVENNSSFTITFAASGISNVADGSTSAIPPLCSRLFIWDANANLWYRCA